MRWPRHGCGRRGRGGRVFMVTGRRPSLPIQAFCSRFFHYLNIYLYIFFQTLQLHNYKFFCTHTVERTFILVISAQVRPYWTRLEAHPPYDHAGYTDRLIPAGTAHRPNSPHNTSLNYFSIRNLQCITSLRVPQSHHCS